MTTLNAKANTAYNDLIAKTERENPGDVWAGFDGDQEAFETGFETGYEAARPVALGELSDALLMVDTYDVIEGDVVPASELWAVVTAARKVLDAAARPVFDREALIEAAAVAMRPILFDESYGKVGDLVLQHRAEARRMAASAVDAVLALLNGGAK